MFRFIVDLQNSTKGNVVDSYLILGRGNLNATFLLFRNCMWHKDTFLREYRDSFGALSK